VLRPYTRLYDTYTYYLVHVVLLRVMELVPVAHAWRYSCGIGLVAGACYSTTAEGTMHLHNLAGFRNHCSNVRAVSQQHHSRHHSTRRSTHRSNQFTNVVQLIPANIAAASQQRPSRHRSNNLADIAAHIVANN